ncbi:MAG: rRNA pseudouridine synthase [Angelakisella sp.]|jgi:16S rRNA pseudouridine516 synthase|nr:rRNA pseudouridine synthase [Angelakisella sp.]
MRPERLDKVLAGQSTWSRREVRDWIKGGLVTVNGAPVRDPGQKIIQETDRVAVKGREITLRRNLYLMMDKPAGVVSASRDDGCPTVVDLVPPELKRPGLFPAGRLDKDTTGMVIITDDGALAHRILSPKSHVPKVYLAHIDSFITNAMIQGFAQGIPVGEEGVTLPAELVALDLDLARVTLREGMYHQIKRMFASYGAKVLELRRVSMGGLVLDGTLGPGGCRELTPRELILLQQTDPA